jgi:hypothetical protein
MSLASALFRPWKVRVFVITGLLAVLPSLLFANTFKLQHSSVVPGAAGEVRTGTDRNGNTTIRVDVQHLAKPDALTPSMSIYVVWLQQPGRAPERQGVLDVNDKLEGRFESSTPSKQFDLWITAEHDRNIKSPSGPEVLRATGITP